MAALAQIGQGNDHTSTLSSPGSMAATIGTVEESTIVVQTFTVVRMSLARQLRATAFQWSMGGDGVGAGVVSKKSRTQCTGKGCHWPLRSPLLQCYQCQGLGPYGQRMHYTSIHFKPAQGELREFDLPPSWWRPPKATKEPPHTHPDPWPRLANMKMARQSSMHDMTPAVPFLNPDPSAHLVGQSNEAPIMIAGQKMMALTDLGAHVSSVSLGFCKQMALRVHPLDRLLELEGTGSWGMLRSIYRYQV